MNLRALLAMSSLTLMTACASVPGDVRPVSGDTFEVEYYAGFARLSWVEIKNRMLQSADAHCSERKQKVVNPVITTNRATGLMPKRASTRFRCVDLPVPAARAG